MSDALPHGEGGKPTGYCGYSLPCRTKSGFLGTLLGKS
jgi:hypothetical protein